MFNCTFFSRAYQHCSNRIVDFKNAQTVKSALAGLVPGYYAIAAAHYFSDYLGHLINDSDHAPFYIELPLGLAAFLLGYTFGALSCMAVVKLVKPAIDVDAALFIDDRKQASSDVAIHVSSYDLSRQIEGVSQRVERIEEMFQGFSRLRFSSVELMRGELAEIKSILRQEARGIKNHSV